MSVKPIPDGFHTITPYMIVDGADAVIAFMKKAFDATEMHMSRTPDGRVMHAQYRIGNSMLMISDTCDGWEPMKVNLYLYLEDVDAVYQKAVDAGATTINAPRDEFYGDRCAGVKDPAGNSWWIGTHIEDVPPDEIARRAEQAMKQGQQQA